jgi:hypothetical protein
MNHHVKGIGGIFCFFDPQGPFRCLWESPTASERPSTSVNENAQCQLRAISLPIPGA